MAKKCLEAKNAPRKTFFSFVFTRFSSFHYFLTFVFSAGGNTGADGSAHDIAGGKASEIDESKLYKTSGNNNLDDSASPSGSTSPNKDGKSKGGFLGAGGDMHAKSMQQQQDEAPSSTPTGSVHSCFFIG